MKDEVTFTFHLGGNSVCGQEDKPDSCLECDKLTSCVMDMFHEAVERNEPDPLDIIDAFCNKRAEMTSDANRAMAFIAVSEIVDKLKTKPSQVIERAKIEGWCP